MNVAPVSDRFLAAMAQSAHTLQKAPLTALESEALLHHLPELLDELRQRRAAMSRSNVLPLPMLRPVEGGRP